MAGGGHLLRHSTKTMKRYGPHEGDEHGQGSNLARAAFFDGSVCSSTHGGWMEPKLPLWTSAATLAMTQCTCAEHCQQSFEQQHTTQPTVATAR